MQKLQLQGANDLIHSARGKALPRTPLDPIQTNRARDTRPHVWKRLGGVLRYSDSP